MKTLRIGLAVLTALAFAASSGSAQSQATETSPPSPAAAQSAGGNSKNIETEQLQIKRVEGRITDIDRKLREILVKDKTGNVTAVKVSDTMLEKVRTGDTVLIRLKLGSLIAEDIRVIKKASGKKTRNKP